MTYGAYGQTCEYFASKETIYVFGGLTDSSSEYIDFVQKYDMINDVWFVLNNKDERLTVGRAAHESFVYQNYAFIVAGISNSINATTEDLNTTDVFDMETETMVARINFAKPAWGPGVILINENNEQIVYTFGGFGNDGIYRGELTGVETDSPTNYPSSDPTPYPTDYPSVYPTNYPSVSPINDSSYIYSTIASHNNNSLTLSTSSQTITTTGQNSNGGGGGNNSQISITNLFSTNS